MTPEAADPYQRLAAVDGRWFALLEQVGLDVVRGSSSFVSYDGAGRLNIAPPADLDADDTVAALALHELCHLAVRGDAGMGERDWGLTYLADGDLADEYAALRLQRWLATSVDLAGLLHPTTEHRAYYEALAACGPLAPVADQAFAAHDDRARALAAQGKRWLLTRPWWPALGQVLEAAAAAVAATDAGPAPDETAYTPTGA